MNSDLPTPELALTDQAPDPIRTPRRKLNARSALGFLIFYILNQTVGQFIGGFAYGLFLAATGTLGRDLMNDPKALTQFNNSILLPAAAFGIVFSGIVVYLRARQLDVNELRSSNGAAWQTGTPRGVLIGLAVGVVVAVGYLSLAKFLLPWVHVTSLPPMLAAASRAGSPQMFWIICIVMLAPVIEEPLFRGIMFAGFSRSFGTTRAAIMTTSLFVASHFFEFIHFWPGAIGILGLSVTAQALRTRTGAIGPSIAAHFAYNSLLAAWLVYATSR